MKWNRVLIKVYKDIKERPSEAEVCSMDLPMLDSVLKPANEMVCAYLNDGADEVVLKYYYKETLDK